MKLIIAGSRSFNDYRRLEKVCNWFWVMYGNYHDKPVIVSGGAEGADKLGERWAKENNLQIVQFFPDWKNFGKSAAAIRNRQMADYGTHCICFWDGKSRGTKMMIDFATQKGLVVLVEMGSSNAAGNQKP